MTHRRKLLAAALVGCTALGALLAPAVAGAQAAPKVHDAWARPTVEGQMAGGGYLKIVGGSVPDRLLGISAGVAARVEMHQMSMDGNVMRMRQIDAIVVPAGATVALEPGGLHLMFMGLKAPLKVGSRFPLTLRFEKGGEVGVEMSVAPMAGAAHGHKP